VVNDQQVLIARAMLVAIVAVAASVISLGGIMALLWF
jgi:hypothetical protein